MEKVLKKLKFGKVILFFVILFISLGIFKIIDFNRSKKPIDLEDFRTYMQSKDYTVTEIENNLETKKAYKAENNVEESEIKVIVYEFLTIEQAQEFYENKKAQFEKEDNGLSSSFGWEINNFSKYQLKMNDEYEYKHNDRNVLDKYKVVYRVDNVVMYSDVNIDYSKIFSSNKKEVEKIFKKFGY